MDLVVRLDQLRFLGKGAEAPLVTQVTQVTPVTRVASVLILALGLALGLVAMPIPGQPVARAAEGYPVPASGVFRLDGLGYGHGIGMSQFGAEGMGRLGKNYRQIMKFYFPGTTFANVTNERTIRVLVSGLTHSSGSQNYVQVRPRKGLRLVTGSGPRDLPRRVAGGPVTSYRVVRNDSSLAVIAHGKRGSDRVVGGLKGVVQFSSAQHRASSRVSVMSTSGSVHTYRGFFDVRRGDTGLLPISDLLLEDYLRSVVAHEVPSSWTKAALQAQAVAARSYALVARLNARAAGRVYDICDTTSCQAYGSIAIESGPETNAVHSTRGVYLSSAGQPALTMFSSANGGYTVSGGRGYLVAEPDPYDGVVTGAANWGHSWSDTVSASTIEHAWPQIGSLKSIRVLARDGNGDWGGRVLSVGIVGSKDTISVSGDTFRWAAGLKSTWWTVTNVTPDAKAPPRNVQSSPRDQGLRVRWSAPNSDKRVRSYQVVVSPGNHTYKVPAKNHSLRVRQLTNGREYHARVRAMYHNGAGPPGVAPAVVPTSPMSYYRPLTPRRLLNGATTSAGGTRSVKVVGKGRAPVWGTRVALLRVTAAGDGDPGRVLAWPKGLPDRQVVAAVYPADGGSSGVVTVPVNDSGYVILGTANKSKGLTVDLLGYYTASGVGGSAFQDTAPQRIVSSVSDRAWDGGRLREGSPREIRIAGRGSVPDGARRVLINVTLLRPTESAALSMSPLGSPPWPGTAVRAPRGEVRSATTVAHLDADGRLTLRLSAGRSDVAVDVLGWFHAQRGERGGRYKGVQSRSVLSPSHGGTLAVDQTRTIKVRGGDTGIPPTASAVALQVVARGKATAGSVRLTPTGVGKVAPPSVNFGVHGVARNLIVVPVGTGGQVSVQSHGARAEVSVEIVGWYS